MINVYKRISESQNFLSHEDIDYEIPLCEDSEYCVDDSSFVPISEAIKQLQNVTGLTDAQENQFYDFPDGKDTGITVPITRKPRDYSDITEVSTEITNKVKSIVETKEKLNKQIAEDNAFKASVDSTLNKESGKSE